MTVVLITSIKRFSGASGDVKPTSEVPAGSTFYEGDTGNRYFYNGSAWVPDTLDVQLLAGTAIVGQVAIDQTTDGTTNKVRVFQPTHDNLNLNANLQVGNADNAVGNPAFMQLTGRNVTGGVDVVAKFSFEADDNGDLVLRTVDASPAGYDQPTDSIKTSLQNEYIETVKGPYIITNLFASGEIATNGILVVDEFDWEAVDFRSVMYAFVGADVAGSNALRWLGFRSNTFTVDYVQQSWTQVYDRSRSGFVSGLPVTEDLISSKNNDIPSSYGTTRVATTTVRLYPGSRWQRFEIQNTSGANAWPYYSIQRIGFR